jgi:hypothetical protein
LQLNARRDRVGVPAGAQLGLQHHAQAPLVGADQVVRRVGRVGE